MSRILVVDDSQIIRELLKESLTGHGHEVAVADTGEEGLKRVHESPPELIILDIHLPDVRGEEFCKMIRARTETRHIPVIMITSMEKDKVKGFQAGADDYVMKPFDIDEFVERVRAVMRRSQQLSRAAASASPAGISAPDAAPELHNGPDLPLRSVAILALLDPGSLSARARISGLIPAFLIALVLLTTGGLVMSASAGLKPALGGLLSLAGWGLSVAVLAVSCSLFGSALTWPDSARLVSLAGLPLLLKAAGACIFTVATSLDPFFFTASPGLIFDGSSFWILRLDLFELWGVALLWTLLSGKAGIDRPGAVAGSICVWLVFAGLLAGASRLAT